MRMHKQVLIATLAGSLLPATVMAQPRAAAAEDDVVVPDKADVDERGLTAQDRQILEWAKQCVSRIEGTMEEWVKSGRVSKEKLFAFLYFPIPDTDPQKFSTDYDALADAEIAPIQEECLAKAPEIRFVVTVDKNGYLPAHNQRYSQPLTGHRQIDLTNNRTKRIFNDRTGIRAARNTDEFLLQKYFRDTGEVMKDLSVPLIIDGKHWGSLRYGYVSK